MDVVGALISAALVDAVGNAKAFKNGLQLAVWLGLVPHQHSTGGTTTLLGISKRGNRYLRTLLTHRARGVIYRAKDDTMRRARWLRQQSSTSFTTDSFETRVSTYRLLKSYQPARLSIPAAGANLICCPDNR
jgi:hypothetical protein